MAVSWNDLIGISDNQITDMINAQKNGLQSWMISSKYNPANTAGEDFQTYRGINDYITNLQDELTRRSNIRTDMEKYRTDTNNYIANLEQQTKDYKNAISTPNRTIEEYIPYSASPVKYDIPTSDYSDLAISSPEIPSVTDNTPSIINRNSGASTGISQLSSNGSTLRNALISKSNKKLGNTNAF